LRPFTVFFNSWSQRFSHLWHDFVLSTLGLQVERPNQWDPVSRTYTQWWESKLLG